jgi:hypothetical protein
MNETPAIPKQVVPMVASGGATTINCRFEKTRHFQSVFVIGAWGRISGHGEIILSCFNEVPELVSNAVYSMGADGKFIGMPKLDMPNGMEAVVREIPVELILTLDGARNIVGTLEHWIKLREQMEAELKRNAAEQKTK